MSSTAPPPVDKEFLFGEFNRNARWRDKLARKGAFKALDMVDDEMEINVTKGMGWRELAILALGLIGAAAAWRALQPPAGSPPAAAAADTDTDTVGKYDFDVSVDKR
jgi:hypothetical protein